MAILEEIPGIEAVMRNRIEHQQKPNEVVNTELQPL